MRTSELHPGTSGALKTAIAVQMRAATDAAAKVHSARCSLSAYAALLTDALGTAAGLRALLAEADPAAAADLDEKHGPAAPYDKKRSQLVAGLRELADFLDAHPEIPTPTGGFELLLFPPRTINTTDADEDEAEVDRMCALLGVTASRPAPNRHYVGTREFGPVSLCVVSTVRTDRGWKPEPKAGEDQADAESVAV